MGQSVVRMFLMVCLVVGTTGCAVLSSSSLPEENRPGVVYMLPKALVQIQLTESEGRFTLTVGEPTLVGDPEKAYMLRYLPSLFASDTFDIEVDDKTGLLKSVQTKAEDKLDEIIIKAVESAVAIAELASGSADIVLLDRKIDPANKNSVKKLQDDLNTAAVAHAKLKSCSDAEAQTAPLKCAAYRTMAATENPITFFVTPPPPLSLPTSVDCTIGICYRTVQPYEVGFRFPGTTDFATTLLLPNASPAIALDISRAPFVTKITNITLASGMLQKVHVEKPSEALDFVAIPLEATKAVLRVPGEIVQLKADLTGKEAALAQQQVALINAEKELQQKRLEHEGGSEASKIRSRRFSLVGGNAISGATRLPRGPSGGVPPPLGTSPTAGTLTTPGSPGTGSTLPPGRLESPGR